jgi:hypothetical protein
MLRVERNLTLSGADCSIQCAKGSFHRMRAEFWLERKSRRASLAIQGFLRSRTELQLFSAELALMRRHTMQACKFVGLMILLCAAMVSPAADGGWLKPVPEADRRPEEACLKTTAPNVTQRMPPGAGNGQACEAIACSVPPTEKSSGYGETATAEGYAHPGGVARADALADYLLHQEPGACHARRRSLRC